ncbi:CocE/NonD family hydrolase [Paenibacillus sp. HB172176]|uniref:CocE/NonD family hydrolase n=1 Tax=Paenibacillus sp. HB172176 TaxID=2493690 RepID=UPI00143A4D85|nr:CocE/NonD family hydrolase [Paenibacillus sp. HB172176]
MGIIRFGGCTVERKQACVMRDGVVLYADIYRPGEAGLYPVLLMRQPYGRMIASTITQAHPVWYARQGFIVIIQDVRGRGDSQGEFDPFIHEAEDGFDTVEWAAALPQSNGHVGMYGFSYQGCTQWAAASQKPPSLKAIAPGMCGADLYHGMIYPQGRFAAAEHVPWAFQLARDAARRAGDAETERYCTLVRKQTPDDLLYPIMENGSHPILRKYFPAYEEWLRHSAYDEYWEKRSWAESFLEQPIPAFLIGGWYDVFLMGTLGDYDMLKSVPRTGDLAFKLKIGPWDHIPWGRYSGGVDHGGEADGNIHVEQAEWFKYWLDPKRKPIDERSREPEVSYYERGSCEWMTSRQGSPLSSAGELREQWLNGSEKPANGSSGGGRLLEHRSSGINAMPDLFVYDARLPMTLEGYQPKDRRVEQDRYEALVYTSAPLAYPTSLYGAPKVAAQAQTMGGPTDLVAILSVVGADGAVTFLTAGVAEITAEAGEHELWQNLSIELRPIAIELQAGEAIRLELTGSAYPLFARHPNGRSISKSAQAGPQDLLIASVAVNYESSKLQLPVRAIEKEEDVCIDLAMAEMTGL